MTATEIVAGAATLGAGAACAAAAKRQGPLSLLRCPGACCLPKSTWIVSPPHSVTANPLVAGANMYPGGTAARTPSARSASASNVCRIQEIPVTGRL